MGKSLTLALPSLLLALLLGINSAVADIGARAIVQDDGTLKINGKTVRLYGVLIPTLFKEPSRGFHSG